MAKANEVKGVTAKRSAPLVIPKETDPKRQFMPKAEAVKQNERLKKAEAAAEEARQAVLAEAKEEGEPKAAPASGTVSAAESKVNKLRSQLAHAKAKLNDDPDSKARQKKVKQLEEELEIAEAEVG